MHRLLLVPLLLLAGCGGGEAREPTKPRHVVEGTSVDGERVSLADFRGKPVFVVVWSSWWGTCNSEAVAFAEFSKDHPRVAFLGLNVADDPSSARQFEDRYGWTWPSIQDRRRRIAKRLGASYQPAYFVFDRSGKKVGEHIGGAEPQAWEALLRPVS